MTIFGCIEVGPNPPCNFMISPLKSRYHLKRMERVRTSKHPSSVASCYFFGSTSVCHLPKNQSFQVGTFFGLALDVYQWAPFTEENLLQSLMSALHEGTEAHWVGFWQSCLLEKRHWILGDDTSVMMICFFFNYVYQYQYINGIILQDIWTCSWDYDMGMSVLFLGLGSTT